MTTKEIENIAYNHLWAKGKYLVFEVAAPRELVNKYHRERVDLLMYESTGIWKCFEIKNSVSDFRSSAKHSFWADYNYYILNADIYESVKDEIPNDIGVWLVYKPEKSKGWMECVKKPKKRKRLCSHESLMFALMQGLSREYKKYRKIKEKEDKKDKRKCKKKMS